MAGGEDTQAQPGNNKLTFFISSLFRKKVKLRPGNLLSEIRLAKSHAQELDQEKDFGWTPKLPDPTQLADTPQEEALRLDV